MNHLRLTGLFAAGSLLLFGLGCPPDDPDDPDDPEVTEYEVMLAGENQVPPVATSADGSMDVEFDEDDNVLTIDGEFDNLVSELIDIEGAEAHIHEGTIDEAGPVIYNLDVDADGDDRSGTFEFDEELTDEEVELFENNELYVNIHTDAYPGGELRGQLDDDAPEYEDIDQSWGTELDDDEHLHDVDTDASGWAWSVLRDDDAFVTSGAVQDLSSEVTEVVIEAAPEGETGEVVFELDHEMTDDEFNNARFWFRDNITEDQVGVLEDGHYYINVYTEDFDEEGELRGQIDEERTFWDDLFDGDEDRLDEIPPF